jgi:hypothetical protein
MSQSTSDDRRNKTASAAGDNAELTEQDLAR